MNASPRAVTTIGKALPGNPVEAAALGEALTPIEQLYLAEYAMHGDMKRMAACMGRTVATVKNTLLTVHRKTGTDSSVQSMYRLGWISVPVKRHAA